MLAGMGTWLVCSKAVLPMIFINTCPVVRIHQNRCIEAIPKSKILKLWFLQRRFVWIISPTTIYWKNRISLLGVMQCDFDFPKKLAWLISVCKTVGILTRRRIMYGVWSGSAPFAKCNLGVYVLKWVRDPRWWTVHPCINFHIRIVLTSVPTVSIIRVYKVIATCPVLLHKIQSKYLIKIHVPVLSSAKNISVK